MSAITREPGWRGVLRIVVQVWALVLTLFGSFWVLQNLGDVPRYGDSMDYVDRARTLRLNAFRGIAYPALLAGLDRLWPGDPVRYRVPGEEEEVQSTLAPGPELVLLQILQLLALLGALGYFLRVVRPLGAGASRRAEVLLLLLLVTDPLLAHFQFAVFTDGLTLSAGLVFCAAAGDYLFGSRRARSLLILGAAGFACAALRVEKSAVLVGAAVMTMAVTAWLERGRPRAARRLTRGRGLTFGGVALSVALGSVALQGSFRNETEGWSSVDYSLCLRVTYPNLAHVYGELPADLRKRMTKKTAELHDAAPLAARQTIDWLVENDPVRRHATLVALAQVVLRERWGWIARDVLADALENVLVTPSFYLRTLLSRPKPGGETSLLLRDFARWTYTRLSEHHRVSSLWLLLLAGPFFFLCLLLAAGRVLRSGGRTPLEPGRGLLWLPLGSFVLANALVFALTADMVHVRYALVGHAALLLVVYSAIVRWITTPPPAAATARVPDPVQREPSA